MGAQKKMDSRNSLGFRLSLGILCPGPLCVLAAYDVEEAAEK